jgi:hypothetical protein
MATPNVGRHRPPEMGEGRGTGDGGLTFSAKIIVTRRPDQIKKFRGNRMDRRDGLEKIEEIKRDEWKENAELYRLNLQYLMRFYFFFTGLIFAILSFSMQYSIKTSNNYIKISEIIAWFLLLIAGILGLKEIGAFTVKNIGKILERLRPAERLIMWIFFIGALLILVIARAISSFLQ